MLSIVLDLIVVALLALGVLLGVKRGFVRTVIEGLGCVLIFVLASTLSQPVADAVYEGSVRPAIESAVVSGVGDSDMSDPDETVDQTFESMPGAAANLLKTFGVTPDSVKDTLDSASERTVSDVAKTVADITEPPLTGLIRVVFVLLLFIIGLILIRLLAGVANKIANHIPVVGKLNKILGGAAGLLKGLAFAFVVANLFMLLISLSADGFLGFTAESVENSVLFSRLCWVMGS